MTSTLRIACLLAGSFFVLGCHNARNAQTAGEVAQTATYVAAGAAQLASVLARNSESSSGDDESEASPYRYDSPLPPSKMTLVYLHYADAVSDGSSMHDLLPIVAAEERARILSLSKRESEEELSQLLAASPTQVTVEGEESRGDYGRVKLEGQWHGKAVRGDLLLVRERGGWKMRELRWQR